MRKRVKKRFCELTNKNRNNRYFYFFSKFAYIASQSRNQRGNFLHSDKESPVDVLSIVQEPTLEYLSDAGVIHQHLEK